MYTYTLGEAVGAEKDGYEGDYDNACVDPVLQFGIKLSCLGEGLD